MIQCEERHMQHAERMDIPCDQRLILAWPDHSSEVVSLINANPGLRRLYIVESDNLTLPDHPSVIRIPFSRCQELRKYFERDAPFFSEGCVRIFFGQKILQTHSRECADLQQQLLQFTQQHISRIALRATRGWHILANELCNLPNIQHSMDQLSDIWIDDPVVIVGAGPSLDDTAPILKQYRNRVRIIACDGAWATLIKNDIEPDLIVSTDDSHKVWEYFKQPTASKSQTAVIAMLQSCCQIARHYSGPVYFARNGRNRDELLAKKHNLSIPILNSGLCVGHAALEVIKTTGARQIIMTGFDLGYKNGQFHPTDQPNPYYHNEPPPDANRFQTPANEGGTIETELSMEFYRQEFGRRIAQLNRPVINATAGGAVIENTLYKSVDRELSALPEVPQKTVTAEQIFIPPIISQLKAGAERFLSELNHDTPPIELTQKQPDFWMLIVEAINPALLDGIKLSLHDVRSKIPAATEKLQHLLMQLKEEMVQQTKVVHALCKLEWPRPQTCRALVFCQNSMLGMRLADHHKLEVIPHTLNPNNLPLIWEIMADESIDSIIADNTDLAPALWMFSGVQCFDSAKETA